MIEALKIVAALLGGGLTGALLNRWFQSRDRRLQRIPLIERVNRIVSHQLQGITLARKVGNDSTHLEELNSLREYQLTLRNTSTIHLQDVEIQFEFPTEDSQAWASRTVL